MHVVLINFGYLDPGTGSIIIQAVIGAIAGIAVFGRRTIRSTAIKIKALFAKKKSAKKKKEEAEEE